MAVTHRITDARALAGGLYEVDVQVNRGDGPQTFTVALYAADVLPAGQADPAGFARYVLRRLLTGTTLAALKLLTEAT